MTPPPFNSERLRGVEMRPLSRVWATVRPTRRNAAMATNTMARLTPIDSVAVIGARSAGRFLVCRRKGTASLSTLRSTLAIAMERSAQDTATEASAKVRAMENIPVFKSRHSTQPLP